MGGAGAFKFGGVLFRLGQEAGIGRRDDLAAAGEEGGAHRLGGARGVDEDGGPGGGQFSERCRKPAGRLQAHRLGQAGAGIFLEALGIDEQAGGPIGAH